MEFHRFCDSPRHFFVQSNIVSSRIVLAIKQTPERFGDKGREESQYSHPRWNVIRPRFYYIRTRREFLALQVLLPCLYLRCAVHHLSGKRR